MGLVIFFVLHSAELALCASVSPADLEGGPLFSILHAGAYPSPENNALASSSDVQSQK